MTIDLKTLSRDELESLSVQIQDELQGREARKLQDARDAIARIAAEAGVTVEELLQKTGGGRSKTKSARAPVAPKYRDPSDASATWSGRGRQPLWVQAHIGAGGTLDQLLIK